MQRICSSVSAIGVMPPSCARSPAAMLIKLSIVLSSVANLRTFGRCAKLHQSGETTKNPVQGAMAKRACVIGVPSGFAA
jgi:hypothetical protein